MQTAKQKIVEPTTSDAALKVRSLMEQLGASQRLVKEMEVTIERDKANQKGNLLRLQVFMDSYAAEVEKYSELVVHVKRLQEAGEGYKVEEAKSFVKCKSIEKEAVKDRGDLVRLKKQLHSVSEQSSETIESLRGKIAKQKEKNTVLSKRAYDAECQLKKLHTITLEEVEPLSITLEEVEQPSITVADVIEKITEFSAVDVASVRTALTAHMKGIKKVE